MGRLVQRTNENVTQHELHACHKILQGRIQGFKLGGGGALKKKCAERREARKFLGYFVGKITILRQKIIFFPIAEGGAKIFGVFRVKNHDFKPKNHIFSNFRWGARRVRPLPPLDPHMYYTCMYRYMHIFNLKNKTCGSNNEY